MNGSIACSALATRQTMPHRQLPRPMHRRELPRLRPRQSRRLLSATDVLLATDGQLHAADMLSHGLSAGAGYDLLPYDYVRSVHWLSAHCDETGHVVCHAGLCCAVHFLQTRGHGQLCAGLRHRLYSDCHDRCLPGHGSLFGSVTCVLAYQLLYFQLSPLHFSRTAWPDLPANP